MPFEGVTLHSVHDGVVYFPLFLSLPSRTEIQPCLEGRHAVVRGPFSR